jgi:hypothetical protein
LATNFFGYQLRPVARRIREKEEEKGKKGKSKKINDD